MIASSQTIIDICGAINYNVVTSIDISINIEITYIQSTSTIIVYCDDMSLVNTSISYTIEVTFSQFTNCGSACLWTTPGTIIIISPCQMPTINVGVIINIDFSFNGPATWTPPPVWVEPSICFPEVIYGCYYVSGPYTGTIDLCSFVDYSSIYIDISFNVSTGVFIFDTDDYTTFMPGVYYFMVTVTVEGQTVEISFSLTIYSHCEIPTLTVVHQPLVEYYYVVGEPVMTVFSYNLATVVTSSLTVNCG